MEVAWLLGFRGPWQYQMCREASDLGCQRYGSIRSLFKPLAAGNQRAALPGAPLLLGTSGSPRGILAEVLTSVQLPAAGV